MRTGRCETFAEAAAKMVERRAQLHELAQSLGVALACTGTHPWSRWQDQRIIDTPHYRRNDEILRYVVWRNNTFGLHVHVGIRGADRAVAVCNLLRNFLPELLALSASSPFVEGVDSGLHSARTEIFTRMFPRCGVPDAYDGWAGFERTSASSTTRGSIDEHTQIWWSVRPHLAFPTVEIRICDARARPRRGAVARGAHLHARRAARARARRGRAGRAAAEPPDRGEPLARDPLRALRRADRPHDRRRAARARAHRAADRVGAAGRGRARDVAPARGAGRRTRPSGSARASREGATLREIYAEQVAAGEPVRVADEHHAGAARGAAPQAADPGSPPLDGDDARPARVREARSEGPRPGAPRDRRDRGAAADARGTRRRATSCATSARCSRTCGSPTRTRPRSKSLPRRTRDAGRDRRLRRQRVLLAARGRRGGRGRHPVRDAVGAASRSATSAASASRSCRGTAATTSCRRTQIPTARTSGR